MNEAIHEILLDKDIIKKNFWLLRIMQSVGRVFILTIGLVAYYGTWYYCGITENVEFTGRLADVSLGILFITHLYVFGYRVIPLLNKLKGIYYTITGKSNPDKPNPFVENIKELHQKNLISAEKAQDYIDKYVSGEYPETALPLSDIERIVQKTIEQINQNKK